MIFKFLKRKKDKSSFQKFIQFMEFCIDFKFPKFLKKKRDKELVELYCRFSPLYWNKDSFLRDRIIGAIVIFTVGEELKRRYSNNTRLQNWNYTEEINLHKTLTRRQPGYEPSKTRK